MVFLLLVSFRTFFADPLPSFNSWAVSEELKWHQLTHNQLLSPLIFVHTVQLKPTIKVQISGRMVYIDISDVVTASVYSEKTRLKKLMLIMNKLQESTLFGGCQKLTSAMKQRPEK